MINITIEIRDGAKVNRRGFNAYDRTTALTSARRWAGFMFRNASPNAMMKVQGAATIADFVDIASTNEVEEDDGGEPDFEPRCCPMCDGVHGGMYCPLEDTGWDQCLEPDWAQ